MVLTCGYAETQSCQVVQTKIGQDTSVAIVDTPGFDDTTRTDAEILTLITSFLTSQYQLGIPLKGIVYLHRITDNRMQGTSRRNFDMFQKICGSEALSNVVLLTTMWDKLPSEVEGLNRDQELRENWWSLMDDNGSYIIRFDGSRAMAEAIVALLLTKPPVVLDIQRELHDQGMSLDETAAGRVMLPYIDNEEDCKKLRRHVAEETKQKIQNERKKSAWKDGIQLFAAVTGLAVNFIFNLLPLFGVGI